MHILVAATGSYGDVYPLVPPTLNAFRIGERFVAENQDSNGTMNT